MGRLAVDAESKEIMARPKLLEMLTLPGKAVAADAMHCQRQIAQQVIEQDGERDYALARKGNQGSLRDDVPLFLEDPATPLAQATQVNKRHGRGETRIASVSDDATWLNEGPARNRKGNCAANLALLREPGLEPGAAGTQQRFHAGRLKRAGWDDSFRVSIRSQFTKIHMR